MAAGDPYLTTDADRWLYGVLSVDPLLQQYAPGGFWSQDPDQAAGGVWSNVASYSAGDVAIGSDGLPYRSSIDANIGNDPTTPNSADWQACFPCVRWWQQSPGRDVLMQDGQSSRAESDPTYIVCMLDRQRGGAVDKVLGSNGHIETGNLRIANVLRNRLETITMPDGRTFRFQSTRVAGYGITSQVSNAGDRDVQVGGRYLLRVQ